MAKYKAITEKDSRHEYMVRFLQEQVAEADKNALLFLLNSTEGRWFLMRLLDLCNVNASCFTGNSHTFYNEGKREIGLQVMRMVAALGLEGVTLKQRAELEYIEHQQKMKNLAEESLKEEEDIGT